MRALPTRSLCPLMLMRPPSPTRRTMSIGPYSTGGSVEGIDLGCNCYRVNLHYGYMQSPNIPHTLAEARYNQLGFIFEPATVSYFLSRKTVIPSPKPGMPIWREKLFAWMFRSSANPLEFFCLPFDRVVELGGQVEI